MADLAFDPAAVRRIVAHAKAAPRHAAAFDEAGKPGPAVVLVKDEGIYLMSNGLPRDLASTGGRSFVAYAQGFDPTAQNRLDVWDRARDAVGGDDFAEHLPIEWFEEALGCDGPVVLRVDADSIGILGPERVPLRS